jgi:hypothetical protein
MRVNTAVLAPMPSPSVSTTVAVNSGLFLSARTAYAASRPASSKNAPRLASRYSSFICSTPPKARRAASRASSGDMPRR